MKSSAVRSWAISLCETLRQKMQQLSHTKGTRLSHKNFFQTDLLGSNQSSVMVVTASVALILRWIVHCCNCN